MQNQLSKMAEDEDATYVVTPKAIFMMALSDAGFVEDAINPSRDAEYAWITFKYYMEKAGYCTND